MMFVNDGNEWQIAVNKTQADFMLNMIHMAQEEHSNEEFLSEEQVTDMNKLWWDLHIASLNFLVRDEVIPSSGERGNDV